MRWKAHQRKPQKSTTGRVGVQEGLTMEGIVRIKETKTKINQINTTELQNLKVQQQQQHLQPAQSGFAQKGKSGLQGACSLSLEPCPRSLELGSACSLVPGWLCGSNRRNAVAARPCG